MVQIWWYWRQRRCWWRRILIEIGKVNMCQYCCNNLGRPSYHCFNQHWWHTSWRTLVWWSHASSCRWILNLMMRILWSQQYFVWVYGKIWSLPLLDIEKELSSQVQNLSDDPNVFSITWTSKVYKTDYCVIDLESKADTVICSCGHQCINHANVSASLCHCPLCQSSKMAFIWANGLNVIVGHWKLFSLNITYFCC